MNRISAVHPAGFASRCVRAGLTAAAAVRTARLDRRLRDPRSDASAQAAAFDRIARGVAASAFGRDQGIVAAMPYADFRRRVVPRTYEQFVPWIDRIKGGEPGVLWPGRCAHFAVSSGTTQGPTKYLPVTPAMLDHFRQAGLDSLCLYARRAGRASIFRGRHLFLGGSTRLSRVPDVEGPPIWAGDLSGITSLNLPGWAERLLYEPGREIAQMTDWPAKLRAIAERTVRRDIRLLAGIPSWLLVFAETVREVTGARQLKDVWPNLECVVHGGVPIGPFVGELAAALGEGVNFHEVYPASEGFIAAQDGKPAQGLRLFCDAGIFYEFLPMRGFDAERLAATADDVVPLSAVQPGVDYAMLLSTPAGLCRYVIGDVVRFVTVSPPRLLYVGRTKLQLSAFGEHVLEKEVTDALGAVMARRRWVVSNFHVAPCFVDSSAGVRRGRHEWWLEFRGAVVPGVFAETLGAELDRELQQLNDDYAAKRSGGGMDHPVVRIVAAGTFERWLRAGGKWGGQHKMPRCRSDRSVADQLAGTVADDGLRRTPGG